MFVSLGPKFMFWLRLSILYSVLGLPLVPRVFGRVVSGKGFKQKVGGSIPLVPF